MGKRFDARGIDPDQNFPIIEEPGWYPFQITVATPTESKNKDYMVVVDALCLDDRWQDISVRHWVTFLPKTQKGAGMAIHFLKSIGEPWEGQIEIEPLNWERKRFMGKVGIELYNGKRQNKFEAISAIKDAGPEPAEELITEEEEAPF